LKTSIFVGGTSTENLNTFRTDITTSNSGAYGIWWWYYYYYGGGGQISAAPTTNHVRNEGGSVSASYLTNITGEEALTSTVTNAVLNTFFNNAKVETSLSASTKLTMYDGNGRADRSVTYTESTSQALGTDSSITFSQSTTWAKNLYPYVIPDLDNV